MITRPEWAAASAQLEAIAQENEARLRTILSAQPSLDAAIAVTRQQSAIYHAAFESHLADSLVQGALTTVDHYDKELGLNLSEAERNTIAREYVQKQYVENYYGATLTTRLHWSRFMQEQRIMRSSRVGLKFHTRLENLARVFVYQYPFGSALAHDKRIMLSQMVKVEHDIAREMGRRANVELVKWTLSHTHKVKDICDELAADTDPDIGMPGVYRLEDVPPPPHPNCQCTLVFLHKDRVTSTFAERAVEKLKELWGKLRKRRPN